MEENDGRKVLYLDNIAKDIYLPGYTPLSIIICVICSFLIGIAGACFFLFLDGFEFIAIEPLYGLFFLILTIVCLILPFPAIPVYIHNRNKIKYNNFFIVVDKIDHIDIVSVRKVDIYEAVFENLSKYLDYPVYISPADLSGLKSGDECFIFLPEVLKPSFLSYYTPIRILKTSEYKLDVSLEGNVIPYDEYLKEHVKK